MSAPLTQPSRRRPALVPGLQGSGPGRCFTAAGDSPSPQHSGLQYLAILGCTGSIGRSAAELVRRFPEKFKVEALSGHQNITLLAEQVRELRPNVVALTSPSHLEEFRARLGPELLGSIKLLWGPESALAVASLPTVTTVLAGIMGSAGLGAVLEALRCGKRVALANKESLVAGGALVERALREGSGELLPVDSEHAALFQALQGVPLEEVERLTLTASGGPFLRRAAATLCDATPEEATRHPRWKMGAKISIDSATLVNKSLELIEAHWLFGLPEEEISVLVHPESIVHSIVEMVDGTQLAQLSVSDMAGPIAAALTYPLRVKGVLKPLALAQVGALHFEALSDGQFPAVQLARKCLRAGGSATAVFNAANECAVSRFIARELRFDRIVPLVEKAVSGLSGSPITSLAELQKLEAEVHDLVRSLA